MGQSRMAGFRHGFLPVAAGAIRLANIVPLSGPTAQTGQLTEIESNVEVSYFNAHDSMCGHKFVNLDWTATPAVHNGFPSSGLKECELKQGPYDILDAAS
jgi:hypothetical protein